MHGSNSFVMKGEAADKFMRQQELGAQLELLRATPASALSDAIMNADDNLHEYIFTNVMRWVIESPNMRAMIEETFEESAVKEMLRNTIREAIGDADIPRLSAAIAGVVASATYAKLLETPLGVLLEEDD